MTSIGIIIGAVIGGLAAILFLVLLMVRLFKKRGGGRLEDIYAVPVKSNNANEGFHSFVTT